MARPACHPPRRFDEADDGEVVRRFVSIAGAEAVAHRANEARDGLATHHCAIQRGGVGKIAHERLRVLSERVLLRGLGAHVGCGLEPGLAE